MSNDRSIDRKQCAINRVILASQRAVHSFN